MSKHVEEDDSAKCGLIDSMGRRPYTLHFEFTVYPLSLLVGIYLLLRLMAIMAFREREMHSSVGLLARAMALLAQS